MKEEASCEHNYHYEDLTNDAKGEGGHEDDNNGGNNTNVEETAQETAGGLC